MTQSVERIEIADPQAYKNKMFGLLGDREPAEVLAETPGTLTGIVADKPTEVMRSRPFEGKWTPNEILGHLLDVEWAFGVRTRAVYCDNEPLIAGMDQELWVARQGHNERQPAELLAAFRALREINLPFWRRFTPDDLERIGRHSERGPEKLDVMMRMLAGHDLSHIGQIERYLQAIKGS